VVPAAHAGRPLQPPSWSGPSRTLHVSPGRHGVASYAQTPATQSKVPRVPHCAGLVQVQTPFWQIRVADRLGHRRGPLAQRSGPEIGGGPDPPRRDEPPALGPLRDVADPAGSEGAGGDFRHQRETADLDEARARRSAGSGGTSRDASAA